ncbi:MAG: AAA family ATPase [Pseudomonadota bacterium]
MATLHPTLPNASLFGAGAYRERDILHRLEMGLPTGWDIFHSVDWASVHNGRVQIGEVDVAVVSPGGFLVLVEVKAGPVEEGDDGLVKRYGPLGDSKDIGSQLRRNHSGLLSRLKDAGLREVRVSTLLVLPDYRLASPVLGHVSEAIVDAEGLPDLPRRIQQLAPWQAGEASVRVRLLDFLANRFHVVPDASCWISQVQRASAILGAGLATWVPSIRHPSGLYVIEATAGSGKTQLALSLMMRARKENLKCAYICFNRTLADHIVSLAPPACQVSTFHELTVEHARRGGTEPDFHKVGIYDELADRFIADAPTLQQSWDLLILDEHQDLHPSWAQALLSRLAAGGRAYIMGDDQQRIYPREEYDLEDAVVIRCMENFRSPRRVVDTMNQLRLTPEPVVARSAFAGQLPGFHTYTVGARASLAALERCVRGLLEDGIAASQIAIITYAGMRNSAVIAEENIAGHRTKRSTGAYDQAGNALWTEGDLLVETVYRFKGQSAPVVVLCEMEFDQLGQKELCKLFVGMTRAQFRLECVLSEASTQLLMARAS